MSNTYDANGNLTAQSGTGAEAATTARSFGYDADNQLTSVSASGGTDTFTYDDRGLPVTVGGPSSTSERTRIRATAWPTRCPDPH